MEVNKQEFNQMLQNSNKKKLFWQNTGFVVKKIKGKFMIKDEFSNNIPRNADNKYIQFLDEKGEILPGFMYKDFFN